MLAEGIAIGIVVLIGLVLLQIEHHTRKYKIAIVIILIAVIYFSIMSVFSSEEVDLTSPRGMINAVYVYFGWIGTTTSSLWDIGTDTVSMVGNAIKTSNTSEEKHPRR